MFICFCRDATQPKSPYAPARYRQPVQPSPAPCFDPSLHLRTGGNVYGVNIPSSTPQTQIAPLLASYAALFGPDTRECWVQLYVYCWKSVVSRISVSCVFNEERSPEATAKTQSFHSRITKQGSCQNCCSTDHT